MKRILPILFLTLSPLAAQQSELQAEAVRAFQAGDYTSARSLFESLQSMDPKNVAAQNYLRMIALKEKGGPGIESALKKITLSSVDLREVTPREAVTYVGQQVEKLSGGKQKLNVVWLVPPDSPVNTAQNVTLSLQNAPATEVLRYIGAVANLKVAYDANAVRISPAPAE